jgi:hypothetical protein
MGAPPFGGSVAAPLGAAGGRNLHLLAGLPPAVN